MTEVAAVCTKCQGATQKIYEGYMCTECYINKLKGDVEESEAFNKVRIMQLEEGNSRLREELDGTKNLMGYKIAYELLIDELFKKVNK